MPDIQIATATAEPATEPSDELLLRDFRSSYAHLDPDSFTGQLNADGRRRVRDVMTTEKMNFLRKARERWRAEQSARAQAERERTEKQAKYESALRGEGRVALKKALGPYRRWQDRLIEVDKELSMQRSDERALIENAESDPSELARTSALIKALEVKRNKLVAEVHEPLKIAYQAAVEEFLALYTTERERRIAFNTELLEQHIDFRRIPAVMHSYVPASRLGQCFFNISRLEQAAGADTSGYPNFRFSSGDLASDAEELEARFDQLWAELGNLTARISTESPSPEQPDKNPTAKNRRGG
jgi:hypothetical protein